MQKLEKKPDIRSLSPSARCVHLYTRLLAEETIYLRPTAESYGVSRQSILRDLATLETVVTLTQGINKGRRWWTISIGNESNKSNRKG